MKGKRLKPCWHCGALTPFACARCKKPVCVLGYYFGGPKCVKRRSKAKLEQMRPPEPEATEMYCHDSGERCDRQNECEARGVHHLYPPDHRGCEHTHRRTLCGKVWRWHVWGLWSSRYMYEDTRPDTPGCFECRVQLDAALARSACDIKMAVYWKTTIT